LCFVTDSTRLLAMGTIRYIGDPDGTNVGLDEHEGYLEFRLDEPVRDSWKPPWPEEADQGTVYEGWTSTWTSDIDQHRVAVRAACECGWHGPELPWLPGVLETEEQTTALMMPWDRHIDVDVIQGLAWRRCGECGDLFPQMGVGRPRQYCGDACRQAAYRERVR
jgi:hypothetical protein